MKVELTIDVESNPKKILKLIKELKNQQKIEKIILYVVTKILKKYKKQFKKLKKQGIEIGLHGYEHERFDVLTKKQKQERITKAVRIYKEIFKQNPKYFRAPQFSADFQLIEILNSFNFKIDSSTVQFPVSQIIFFPKRLPLYLNQHSFKKKIKRKKLKIKEEPASCFILPISLFSLKLLPLFAFKILTYLSLLFRKDKKIIFLSHSYEFDEKTANKLKNFLK